MAESPPSDSMLRMQQDAMRRVRMMQEKTVKAVPSSPESTAHPQSDAPPPQSETKQPCDTAANADRSIGLSSLINGSNSEELLLLILLLLLSDEKTEPALIMAVLYLML